MAGGGLLQLVAYGAQDIYLTGNPQITFFKVVYRRHTNFAMEAGMQTINGTIGFDSEVTSQISRSGDLIHRMYLQINIPAVSATTWVEYIGLRLLREIEIEIGGQRIDKQYSDWLYIWNALSLPLDKQYGYDLMVGASVVEAAGAVLYVPLEFWFNRNVGLSLPLIALQYHEVKVYFRFESQANCFATNVTPVYTAAPNNKNISSTLNATLWVDYIYLDTDERRRFAQLSHEYLIEQVQTTGIVAAGGVSPQVKINFNHPCKEFIWYVQKSTMVGSGTANNWTNFTTGTASSKYSFIDSSTGSIVPALAGAGETDYTDPTKVVNPVLDATIFLNNQERFRTRYGDYFNLVQPYQHHTRIPSNRGINVYSFALKPEEHQPSGSLNLSRIDNTVLQMNLAPSFSNANVKVYAVNYNVLRIMSGMGGLAYSN